MAALKAQKLMAQYDIELSDLSNRNVCEELAEIQTDCGEGNKWKYRLHLVVANNFRCKSYFVGNRFAVFYGYRQDAEIANQVFNFLYNTGNRLGDKVYNEYYSKFGTASGIRNGYLAGYCQGISEILGKQCRALMLVTPQEVEDNFKNKMQGCGKISAILRGADEMYNRGVSDGRAVANSRALEQ